MPFTLSHAAAVLPFARSRRLVPSALVAGSFAPDVPYFLAVSPLHIPGSHTWWGVPLIDVPLGLALWWAWHALMADPMVALLPRRVRARTARVAPRRLSWAVPLSVLIGAITHVVWDGFTHKHGWAVDLLPVLRLELWTDTPLFYALQVGCSVIGAAILSVWAARWLRRTEPLPVPPARTWPARVGVLGVTAAISAVAALAGMARVAGIPVLGVAHHVAAGAADRVEIETALIRGAVGATSGFVLALIAYGVIRRYASHHRTA